MLGFITEITANKAKVTLYSGKIYEVTIIAGKYKVDDIVTIWNLGPNWYLS